MNRRIILLLALTSLLVACGGNAKNTLGKLKYDEEKEEQIEFKKVSHAELRSEYKELIDLFEDKQLKEQIERRIADVYMMESVDTPVQQQQSGGQYVQAIKAYRQVLERYPNSPDNAEVFYQLAKAYDLEGNQDEAMKMLTELVNRHPNYQNIAEAHFRKADIHFNRGEYEQAKRSYLIVTRMASSRLLINAHYMLGWVNYKQRDFEASIDAFTYVLDTILGQDRVMADLDKAEKPLVEDAIHSISLALDKIGGAAYLQERPSLTKQHYAWMIYDYLGNYYLDKELYEESAKTFRSYIDSHLGSLRAPAFHEQLIAAYAKGNFPRQALREKEGYVRAYGIRSDFIGNKNGIDKQILSLLNTYLDELAQYHYGEGQAYQDIIDKEKERNKEKANSKKLAENKQLSVAAFLKSADFYGEYILTFPDDKRVDEMRFLKAEAHFLAGDFLQAAQDYERVAYEAKGSSAKDKASDAGYAAIIAYQNHIDALVAKNAKGSAENIANLRARAVESMLRFAKAFDSDPRSPSVLTNASTYLFGLNEYERAIAIANDLISTNTELDKNLKKTAYGIIAHSSFKLARYDEAGRAYVEQRALVEGDQEEYKRISERIATSYYKHAELVESQQGAEQAAQALLKIKTLTPDSPIRVTAQYDAVSLLMGLSAWSAAITELEELQTLYPEHELAVEFKRKLALAHEKSENWDTSSTLYLDLSQHDPDANIRREALFQAALMFEKKQDYQTAITHFKAYARAYEKPFDTRMEARYRLAINYDLLGEENKKLFWLRRLIDGDKEAGAERTERSQWLAAWANIEYGDYYAGEFERRRLTVPLPKSLPKKQEFFQSASKRYQMAADYGILEFVTQSSFKLGELNRIFARDLRRAPAPKGLSENDQLVYAEIIEEQARPFDELAIAAYEANLSRAWEGVYDSWIEKSFDAVKILHPERYNKVEVMASYGEGIR